MGVRRARLFVAATACGVAALVAVGTPGAAATVQGPAAAADPTPSAPGGTLVVGIDQDPPTLNVAMSSALQTTVVGPQMLSTLISKDPEGRLVPELAESWDISPDGLTYTFQLRRGVTWSDGQPFTSADVVFSINELNRKYVGAATTAFAAVDTITAPDENTVVFKLSYPFPPLLEGAIAQANSAAIAPKHVYEKGDPLENPANNAPVGTGPFVFKEWVRGERIVLERNPNFYKQGKPYVERLIFQVIPDASARVNALVAGEIDYLPYFAVPPPRVGELAQNDNVKLEIDRNRPSYAVVSMFMNQENRFLADKRVRQAIAYAVDRETVASLAAPGASEPGTGPISSQDGTFYNSAINLYERDLEKANTLLDEAGFPAGSGGTRLSLSLNFNNAGEAGALTAAADVIREQLREVGIDVVPDPVDAATWNAKLADSDFDMSMGSVSTGPDPAIGMSRIYLSTNQVEVALANNTHYTNLEVDDLLNQAARELDLDVRKNLYGKAQEIIVDDVPVLWLWQKVAPVVTAPDVTGFPSGQTHFEAYDNVRVGLTDGEGGAAGGDGGGGSSPVLWVVGALIAVGAAAGLAVRSAKRRRV